jgi:hypothetical protein
MSALRRESIRFALSRAGEDPRWPRPAFEAFFAERQRVTCSTTRCPRWNSWRTLPAGGAVQRQCGHPPHRHRPLLPRQHQRARVRRRQAAAWLVRSTDDERKPWAHGARPQLVVPNLHALCMALDAQ